VYSLDQLADKKSARIVRLLDDDVRGRLIEMGCVPGTFITKEFSAPLGDPLAFSINGYMLSMSKALARTIAIEAEK